MYSDKDRPSTWRKYTSGMCTGCHGHCCTMPVEVHLSDLIRLNLITEDEALSPKKAAQKLIKQKVISSYRAGTGLFMLTQKANSDCYFLDSKTRLCQVYDLRPSTCREFPSIGPRPGYCPQGPRK